MAGGGGEGLSRVPETINGAKDSFNYNNNNKKLYLHDYNKVSQYYKSHLNFITNYLIN